MSVKSKYPHVSLGDYNGKPMFQMCQTDDEEQRNKFNSFQFGIEKAKALVEHMDALIAFVESDGDSLGKPKKKVAKASTNGKAKSGRKKAAVVDDDEE